MLSFRSILLAAAAFATVASAIPTPDGNALVAGVANLKRSPDFYSDALARRGQPSCGDIVKKCHDDIAVVIVKIGQSNFFYY